MENLFTNEKIQDIDIVRFSFNEISREQREDIKNKLQNLSQSGGSNFIIDVSKVGFISSLVIATIIFFAKEVREKNGQIKISGLSDEKRSIFQVTHLDKIFELYDSESDALESFKTA